eukprot:31125-Pelagococcus_subviridis.AAC.25
MNRFDCIRCHADATSTYASFGLFKLTSGGGGGTPPCQHCSGSHVRNDPSLSMERVTSRIAVVSSAAYSLRSGYDSFFDAHNASKNASRRVAARASGSFDSRSTLGAHSFHSLTTHPMVYATSHSSCASSDDSRFIARQFTPSSARSIQRVAASVARAATKSSTRASHSSPSARVARRVDFFLPRPRRALSLAMNGVEDARIESRISSSPLEVCVVAASTYLFLSATNSAGSALALALALATLFPGVSSLPAAGAGASFRPRFILRRSRARWPTGSNAASSRSSDPDAVAVAVAALTHLLTVPCAASCSAHAASRCPVALLTSKHAWLRRSRAVSIARARCCSTRPRGAVSAERDRSKWKKCDEIAGSAIGSRGRARNEPSENHRSLASLALFNPREYAREIVERWGTSVPAAAVSAMGPGTCSAVPSARRVR